MIVRDAAPFVTETLETVAPLVDRWLIIDTGSNDDTPDVITQFFADAGIEGTLLRRPWVGFAHNRTELLERCRGEADYALMVDADDLMIGVPPLDRLELDCYRLRFGTDFRFWRTSLFRTTHEWEFRGAVHEYAVRLDQPATTANLEGDYHLVYRSIGTRGSDPDRFRRDIDALHAELALTPDEPRATFYLGQSYRDAGDDASALEWYRRRSEMEGWNEERFVAALELARCLDRTGADDRAVCDAYLAAWLVRPSRAEPLVDLARRHRLEERWADGYLTACRAEQIVLPEHDLLFVNADAYRWRATDERAVCAFYLGLHEDSLTSCEQLLASGQLPLQERQRVIGNRDLALDRTGPIHTHYQPALIDDIVSTIGQRDAPAEVTFTITTCRRRDLFERTMDSFLACCTDRFRIGRWICIDDGSTEWDRALMRRRYPFFEFIFKPHDDRGHARSMNRLIDEVDSTYWLHLEDDWEFITADAIIGRLISVLEAETDALQVVVNRAYADQTPYDDVGMGELRCTPDDHVAYRTHRYIPWGSEQLDRLLTENPGRWTNAVWPGFTLMPSLIRTEAVRGVGAFHPGSDNFERDFAVRAEQQGRRTYFLDHVIAVTTGRRRGDQSPEAPINAYELNGLDQYPVHLDRTIAVIADWTDGDHVAAQWRRQFPAEQRWQGVRLIDGGTSQEQPDYWVVVNQPPAGTPAPPPERTILLQMEPAGGRALHEAWPAPITDFAQVRTHRLALNTLEWHLDTTYDELWTTPIHKTRTMSTIVSGRRHRVGHHLRLDLLHDLEYHGFPIDIYGADNRESFQNYLGPLPSLDKRSGLLPYRYTISIENSAEINYVTEKLTDAVLAECLCFYWGCPNLEDHLGADAFIRLPIEDRQRSRTIIERALANGEYERRLPAIRDAKRRILDELQLAPVLASAVNAHRLVEQLTLHVVNLDRRPDRYERFGRGLAQAGGSRLADRCERFSAVDGAELTMSGELAHTFRGSPSPLPRARTASALSHLALWWEVANGSGTPALIFEDDVTFVDDFAGRLVEVCRARPVLEGRCDIVYLGLSHLEGFDPPRSDHQHVRPLNMSGVIGGLFGYLITKRGAERILALARDHGIKTALDSFVLEHAHDLDLYEAVSPLVSTPVARVNGPIIDSDIQYDRSTL